MDCSDVDCPSDFLLNKLLTPPLLLYFTTLSVCRLLYRLPLFPPSLLLLLPLHSLLIIRSPYLFKSFLP